MFYLPAFIFSSGYSLGLGFLAELRLLVLRQFQAFLAASPCAACASSYHFSSSALPRWHNVFSQFAPVVNSEVSVFASVANRAVKPTCLRQAAYFRSLACEKPALFSPMFYSPAFIFSSGYLLGFCRVPGFAFWCCACFQFFFKQCAASVAHCFFAVCARRQSGASRFGFCG